MLSSVAGTGKRSRVWRRSEVADYRPGALPERQVQPLPPTRVPQALLDRCAALVDEARAFNQERLRFIPDEHISDLEVRIAALRAEL